MKNFFYLLFAFLLFSCDNNSDAGYDASLPQATTYNIAPPVTEIYKVEGVYPHDPTSFTQGFEFYNGKLYEGTGEWGTTKLRVLDPLSGKTEKEYHIADTSVFGEGITIFKDKIYQLTWTNNLVFVYNVNNISRPIDTLKWSREGWGATNDGKNIIISDGSSKLFFVHPDDKAKEMRIDKILTVKSNTGEVDSLNELELINGFVYANRWLTDDIVKIDTSNGNVVGVLNFRGLLKQYDPGVQVPSEAVLNGIAYDSIRKKVFITGKDWPKMFALTLQ